MFTIPRDDLHLRKVCHREITHFELGLDWKFCKDSTPLVPVLYAAGTPLCGRSMNAAHARTRHTYGAVARAWPEP